MEGVANRIQEIIKRKGISNSEMADTIGLPRPILSHILSGRNKPSLAVIQKISEAYSDIDVEWLLIGKESSVIPHSQQEELPIPIQPETIIKPKNLLTPAAEETSPEVEPRKPLSSEVKLNQEELIQIVHYYSNGTFKVFTPKS